VQTERAKRERLRAQPGAAPPAGRLPTLEPDAQPTRTYVRGARILSVGIASTGLLTFAYFSIASHVLGEASAKRIDVLWSVMFVIISVIYRPVEQLLSRTIAERRARGQPRQAVGVPLAIQASFAAAFLALALAFHEQLVAHVFAGSQSLYWILVVGTVAYGASYFARGWLAGHEQFGLFGGLVLTESFSRLCFVLAVAVGVASGETAVALGIAAAPLLSLVVVPSAFARAWRGRRSAHSGSARDPAGAQRSGEDDPAQLAAEEADVELTADEADAALAGPATEGVQEAAAHPTRLSVRRGSGFAIAVSAIMLSEQTLLNAAVLTVAATASAAALAGIVFNVMLIARAPLQLFQAIQTTLLPHLTGLEVSSGRAAFARAVRLTVRWIAVFAAVVALALLAIGPPVMEHALFGQHFTYGRAGLALIGLGMGMHLVSGTLNQAALARGRAGAAAACWLLAAAVFLAWMLLPVIHEQLLRTELGYLGATALLAVSLVILYRRGSSTGPRTENGAGAT
jgi:O-antigen/teichoic acid export membrane protein